MKGAVRTQPAGAWSASRAKRPASRPRISSSGRSSATCPARRSRTGPLPLDVVAGLLLGAAVTLGGYLVLRPLILRVVSALSRTPVRPLLTSGRASTRSGDPSIEGGAVR